MMRNFKRSLNLQYFILQEYNIMHTEIVSLSFALEEVYKWIKDMEDTLDELIVKRDTIHDVIMEINRDLRDTRKKCINFKKRLDEGYIYYCYDYSFRDYVFTKEESENPLLEWVYTGSTDEDV